MVVRQERVKAGVQALLDAGQGLLAQVGGGQRMAGMAAAVVLHLLSLGAALANHLFTFLIFLTLLYYLLAAEVPRPSETRRSVMNR